MIINDGTTNFNINEIKLCYIKLINDNLTFYFNDSTEITIQITDPDNLTSAIDVFLSRMFRQLGTTGAGNTGSVSSGIIYWINLRNSESVSVNVSDVTIEFNTISDLVITYENSSEANAEYEYLNFCFKNSDLSRFKEGKRILKVNPVFVTNIGLDKYRTYTEARSQAVSGDVIEFVRCTYRTGTERFVLKNGVDVVCNDTEFIVNEYISWIPPGIGLGTDPRIKPLFSDETEIVTCYILGTMIVNYDLPNLTGWLCLDVIRSGSKVFMAFEEFKFTQLPTDVTSWIHAYGNSRVWIKGYKSNDSRIYDDDENLLFEYPDSCDYDVLHATTTNEAQGYLFLPYSSFCIWRIRNACFYGELNNTYGEGNGFRFVNSKFLNDGLQLHGVENNFYKQWRCLWSNSYVDGGDGIVQIENYNQSYSNGNLSSSITETNPATVISAGLTIEPIVLDQNLNESQELQGEFINDSFFILMPHIENANQIDLYEDNILIDVIEVIKGQDFKYEILNGNGVHTYKIKARNNSTYINSLNQITNIMPLSNKPIPAKYNPNSIVPEIVYALLDGAITQLTVLEYETEISNPLNDSNGIQKTRYNFLENPSLWLDESKLYSSKNALLSAMKGDYINNGMLLNEFVNNLGNNDYGGHDFESFDFTSGTFESHFDGSVLDGANLKFCTLGPAFDTKAEFASLVKSYDKDTTIWTDGNPIGIVT